MTGNAMRIDMMRSVSRTRDIRAGQDAPGSKQIEFAQMMKRKEQISEGNDERENSSVQNPDGKKEQDKEPVSDKKAPEESENGDLAIKQDELTKVQVSSEVMLQLQSVISRLLENNKSEQVPNTPVTEEPVQDTKSADTVMPPMLNEPGGATLKEDLLQDSSQQLKREIPLQRTEVLLHTENQNSQDVPTAAGEEAAVVREGMDEPVEFRQSLNEANAPKEAVLGPDESPGIGNQPEPEDRNQGSRDAGAQENGQMQGEPVQVTGTQEHFSARAAEFRQPETPVVKTTPETLPDDLGKTLAQSLPKQNGTLTIELEPASLGKLTISVVYEEGKAAVSILATNPKTLELLSQRAGDIANILEEKTGQQTVIYTQEPEQPPFDERRENEEKGQQRQDREENKRQSQPDSFAQQLRLGLV